MLPKELVLFIPLSVFFIISGMVGILFFMVLFRNFLCIPFPIISKLGQNTLGIYVIHLLICCPFSPFLHIIINYLGITIGVSLIFLVLITISYFVTLLVGKTKYVNFILGCI